MATKTHAKQTNVPDQLEAFPVEERSHELWELGVDELSGRNIEAAGRAGDPHWVGYKVWPKFGYDGPISPGIRSRLPQQFQSARRVSDLYKTAEGRAAWAQHGGWTNMTLDLTSGSLGFRVFTEYAKSKGFTVR